MALKRKRIPLLVGAMLLIIAVPLAVYLARNPLRAKADSVIGFDEGSGSTIHDTNGTAAGTITNAVWKSEADCLTGSCLYFDGSGDYVSFGDNNNWDFAAADNFTIEFWFKTGDISSGTRTFVSKYNDTSAGYKIYMSSDGKVTFGIDDDASWGPDNFVTSVSPLDDSLWHHVTAVKTGTTSITLYIDGQQPVTKTVTATGTLANLDNFYVGIDGNGAGNPYQGFLDELRVFTTARTAEQVKTDAQKNAGTSVSFGPDTSNLNNGLVGYWQMDESAGPSLDASGNSHAGTWNDTTSSTVGKFGNGTIFDGSGDYIDAGNIGL